MLLQLTIDERDYTEQASNIVPSWASHGDELMTWELELNVAESYSIYQAAATPEVRLNYGDAVWAGDLVAVTLYPGGGGLSCVAMGKWLNFSASPYTALWSSTSYALWEPITADDDSNYNPAVYEIDTNNRLYIAPVTSQTFTSGAERGGLVFKSPNKGEKKCKAISFSYEMPAIAGWTAVLVGYDEGFTSVSATAWSLASSIGTQTGAKVITLSTAKDYLVLYLYRSGSTASFAGDIGSFYIKLTNVRVATTVSNAVSTTLGTVIAAGTRTVTPASMANIYTGQALVISGSAGSGNERVLVTQTTATTFTAVFANAHAATDSVEAIFVAADEIAEELVTFTNNQTAVSAKEVGDSFGLIQSPGLDLLDETFEERLPSDILIYLASLGDGVESWAVGVQNNNLYFRPKDAETRSWFTDASISELERNALDAYTTIYSIYQDARGRLLRTDDQTDDDAVEIWGFDRRKPVYIATTSETQAEAAAVAELEKTSQPSPRMLLEVDQLSGEGGIFTPALPFMAREGDLLFQTDLPAELVTEPDLVTAVRVSRVAYSVDDDMVIIEPGDRVATLEKLMTKTIAQAERVVSIERKPDKIRVI